MITICTTSATAILPGGLPGTETSNRIVLESVADELVGFSGIDDAPPVRAKWNRFVTVNVDDKATLPASRVGLSVIIHNDGANSLSVYQLDGDREGGGDNDTPVIVVPAGKFATCRCYTPGTWIATLSN